MTLSLCYLVWSCQPAINEPTVLPEARQFRHHHPAEFVIDSTDVLKFETGELFADSGTWGGIPAVDSTLHSKKYLLHSWHGQRHGMTLFTVLVEAMGDALRIQLIGMDSAGKVRFAECVANIGRESGAFSYESRGKWQGTDTVVSISVRAFFPGDLMPVGWQGPDKDTLVNCMVITPGGAVKTLIDSALHSRQFLDTTDWSYR